MDRFKPDQEMLSKGAREDLRKAISESQALLLEHVEIIQEEYKSAVDGYQQIDDWRLQEVSGDTIPAQAA